MVSRRLRLIALVLAAAASACGTRSGASQKSAASASPQVVGACTELACLWLRRPGACDLAAASIGAPPGPYQELQVLDPSVGTTTIGAGGSSFSLTLDESLLSVGWSATTAVNFVIVNDALGGEAYVYNPPTTGDTALASYLDQPITGATFCWGASPFALTVSKTATAEFRRTWSWQIDKSSPTSSASLAVGASVDATYAVTVAAASADSGWMVAGDIVILNGTPVDATGIAIDDSFAGVPATLDCGDFDGTLYAGEVLTCGYTVALAAAFDGTNVVTVTATGGVVGGTASAEVVFGDPTTVVDECVSVADDHVGVLGTVCASAAPATFTYTLPVGPYAACDPSGAGTAFVNTASFSAPSGATGTSSWAIAVQVPCTSSGCTLTQGYWKTHSRQGPAPYDPRWRNLGPLEEQTPFFLSGMTWYEVFGAPVTGSAYLDLAHQYMAAKLNVLAGASASALGNALATAEAFFSTATPATALTAAQRSALVSLASLLDQFNSGLIGPGHCGDRGDDGSGGGQTGSCGGGEDGGDGRSTGDDHGGQAGQGDDDHGGQGTHGDGDHGGQGSAGDDGDGQHGSDDHGRTGDDDGAHHAKREPGVRHTPGCGHRNKRD